MRTKRADLGPAEEPELVQVLGMLELQRRRLVHDRTQAIQRLRADWTQQDPVAEAGVIRCERQRAGRTLPKRSCISSTGKIQGQVQTALLVVQEGGAIDGELQMRADQTAAAGGE